MKSLLKLKFNVDLVYSLIENITTEAFIYYVIK